MFTEGLDMISFGAKWDRMRGRHFWRGLYTLTQWVPSQEPGATSFVQNLECTTSDVQHLDCTTHECTTPSIYNTWIYNNLNVQHLEYTTPRMYNT